MSGWSLMVLGGLPCFLSISSEGTSSARPSRTRSSMTRGDIFELIRSRAQAFGVVISRAGSARSARNTIERSIGHDPSARRDTRCRSSYSTCLRSYSRARPMAKFRRSAIDLWGSSKSVGSYKAGPYPHTVRAATPRSCASSPLNRAMASRISREAL